MTELLIQDLGIQHLEICNSKVLNNVKLGILLGGREGNNNLFDRDEDITYRWYVLNSSEENV